MESLLTYEQVEKALNCKIIGSKNSFIFTNVTTDSRQVCEKSMFVPLVGEFQDGHKYVPQALEKGATVVLINESEYKKNPAYYDKEAASEKVCFVCVENTLTGLQKCAEGYVEQFKNLIKVSITGSCGKTTTKEMLVSLAKEHFGEEYVVYTQGNFNSETGLPLSVFNIRKQHKIGIFEMGMNRVNEIGEISAVLKSQYGIITNIGTAHIGILGSRENIATEKRKSLDYIPEKGAAFVPYSDDFCDFCTEKVKGKIVKYGKAVDCKISGVTFGKDKGVDGTDFYYQNQLINLPLSGEHNYENALGVIAVAKELGFTKEEIKKGFENLKTVKGRMETVNLKLPSGEKVSIVKDCYNANPDSMNKLLDFAESLKTEGEKIFVLADMKELGNESCKEHSKIGERLNSLEFKKLYLIGPEMKAAFEKVLNHENAVYLEEKTDESYLKLSEDIAKSCAKNDVLFFKGSHSMDLDKISEKITELLVGEK